MRGAVIMIHEVRLSLRGDLALPTWRKIRCLRCTWATRIEACSGQLRKATRLCSAAAWCRSSRPPINHFQITILGRGKRLNYFRDSRKNWEKETERSITPC